MALILSACVLQDAVSSESPLGFRLLFLPYGEGGKTGGMFDWASTRHSPMLPLAWASPSMGRPCRASRIKGRATPSVHTSVFWPADLSLGDPKVQETSQSLKVPHDGDSMCRQH